MRPLSRSAFIPVLALAAAVIAPAATSASSSDWFEANGARLRLLTSGAPDAEGHLRGSLEIALRPGWKTYWRDPGQAGVPPTLDVSRSAGITAARMDFPAPQWHAEDGFSWAGYGEPVAFPVEFTAEPGTLPQIEADVFLGVCESICIPVSAKLSVDPARNADDPEDRAAVAQAFETLPGQPKPDFRVAGTSLESGKLIVDAVVPGDPAKASLFLAGGDGYTFAMPQLVIEGGVLRFEVDADRPSLVPTGDGIAYTLVGETGAVSGTIPFF